MASFLTFALLLVAALALPSAHATIKISAFNIQTFGVSKMDKPQVVDKLKQIISMYDMVLIQEIRNKDGTAIQELLDLVNDYSSYNYAMVISSRLGRSSYKEQYAYFYKTSKMSVVDTFEYPDNGDLFEREPFVVLFAAPDTTVGEFAAIGIHAKPDDAVPEIDLLTDVYDYTVGEWGNENAVLMGDFNADCSYVTSSEWQDIRLRTQSRFDWIIPDTDDTTVSGNTHCAYDRFVLAGSTLQTTWANAVPFFFDTYFGLGYDDADDISDHYPVEMTIL